MDRISAITYRAGFSKSPCAWITINETPIEQWCAERFDCSDALSMGLAQIWLLNDKDEQLAWSRITPGEAGVSTIVPILVCSDDMDFNCTVIVIEQLVSDDTVQWIRWGFSASLGLEVGISTKWKSNSNWPLAVFNRDEFENCLVAFKNIMSGRQ